MKEEEEGGDRSAGEPIVAEEATARGTGIDQKTKILEVEELVVVVVVGVDQKRVAVAVAVALRIGSPFDSIRAFNWSFCCLLYDSCRGNLRQR